MPQLDVLRALAVLAVISFHFPQVPPHYPGWFLTATAACKTVGWAGVDLFFVLSGFLVSGLIFWEYRCTDGVRLGRFLVRRGFKIYPAYYAFLGLGLLISPLNGRWAALLCELFFVQNYGPHLWGHTWSLAVEEHFYLSLGLLLFLFSRSSSENALKKIVPAALAVMAVCLLLRLLTQEYMPSASSHRPTHFRLDSLAFGVLISYAYHFHFERLQEVCQKYYRLFLLLGSVFGVAAAAYDYPNWWFFTFGPTAVYLAFGLLLLGAIFAPPSAALWSRSLAWLGYYSYSIYLWHIPVNVAIARIAPAILTSGVPLWALFVAYPILSIVVGVVMARLIEVPFIKLRDRYFPSTTSMLTTENRDQPKKGPPPP